MVGREVNRRKAPGEGRKVLVGSFWEDHRADDRYLGMVARNKLTVGVSLVPSTSRTLGKVK